MAWLDLIRGQVHGFINQRQGTRVGVVARYLWDLNRYCMAQLREDRAGQMAAALTYHTLFSILPTIVLALVILRQFVGPAEQAQFRESIKHLTVQWLESSQVAPPPDDGDNPAASGASVGDPARIDLDPEAAVGPDGRLPLPATRPPADPLDAELGTAAARDEFTETGEIVVRELDKWMDRLSQINFGSIGVAGVLLFIYGATGLLATIERSFNLIYDTPASRPWYVRLPLYYTTITLGPLVLIGGQVLQHQFISLLEQASWSKWLVGPLVVLTPLLATWLVLLLMYVLLPNTRVSLRAAALGSFVAAIGWVVSVELFRVYVGNAAVATLYGALALLPLTLLFLWITWVIVLFGLEVANTLQTLPGRRMLEAQKLKQDKSGEDKTLVDPRWVIPMMTVIGRSFESGKPVRAGTLAQELRLPRSAVATLGERLVREGVLHHIESGEDGMGGPVYTLARPPQSISVSDLMRIGDELSMNEQTRATLPGRDLIEKLSASDRDALASLTLASAVSQGRA